MNNIAAIIVTFNRKQLLSVCVDAIEHQTHKPAVVYIVDNASTDGTDAWIRENGYDGIKSGIEFRYIHLLENIGGSGGFYTGLRMAYEAKDHFDAFWLMDDDGIPDANQLLRLQEHLTGQDYISPLVVAKEDPCRIAFGGSPLVKDFVKQADKNGLIYDVAYPFNGILYSRRLVEKVGYPVRDMFIWGDEVNYHMRCVNQGFIPVVAVDAIHVHPADRQPQQVIYHNIQIVVPQDSWKLYCYVRNRVYNNCLETSMKHVFGYNSRLFFRYTSYFTCYSFNLRKLWIVYIAMLDGLRKDLSRLGVYRK